MQLRLMHQRFQNHMHLRNTTCASFSVDPSQHRLQTRAGQYLGGQSQQLVILADAVKTFFLIACHRCQILVQNKGQHLEWSWVGDGEQPRSRVPLPKGGDVWKVGSKDPFRSPNKSFQGPVAGPNPAFVTTSQLQIANHVKLPASFPPPAKPPQADQPTTAPSALPMTSCTSAYTPLDPPRPQKKTRTSVTMVVVLVLKGTQPPPNFGRSRRHAIGTFNVVHLIFNLHDSRWEATEESGDVLMVESWVFLKGEEVDVEELEELDEEKLEKLNVER